MYRLSLSETAEKVLAQLPKHYQKLVRERIESLSKDPRPHGCKKLQSQTGYRVRQGPYRIIYEIDDSLLVITVTNIKLRREAYR
ncbi:MAG: type II toxin-antitoxin system RelE/ParE family toxin [Thermodesulfobacteriota bacterium]